MGKVQALYWRELKQMLQSVSDLYVYQMGASNGNTEHSLFFPLTTWEFCCGPGWHLSSGWTDLKTVDSEVNAYFKKTINCVYPIGEYNLTKCFEIQFSRTSLTTFLFKVECWNEEKLQVLLLWSFVHCIIQLHNMVSWLKGDMLPSEINGDIAVIQHTTGWLHLSHLVFPQKLNSKPELTWQ